MWNWDKLHVALDSNAGIDGGNPASKYWFIGLEYGKRDGNENAPGNWWDWQDNYYPKIRQIMDAMGVDYKDAFLANLYPIRKQNTLANIDDVDCIDIDDYYMFCDLHGRKAIKDGLKQGDKKTIVCFGLQWRWDYLLQLADGHSAQYVQTHRNLRLVEIKFTNHPHIDRLIVILHISRASLTYCDAVGKYIKLNNQGKKQINKTTKIA